MAESRSFTYVCETVEARTSLGRLETRGTVRLALKEAGLDAASVSPREMCVVVEKILPDELRARGIDAFDSLCRGIGVELAKLPDEGTSAESPEQIFKRLADG